MRIAHLSDLHFGKIAHPEIVGILIKEVNASDVDLVVVSGDLTQRARYGEFEDAAAMLEAIQPPTLVVPGNHDVYPWWNPFKRMFAPLGRFQRFISDDLLPSFEQDGVAVLGVNSAHGRTIKGGRIASADREAMEAFFESRGADVCKVLVVHHHLTKIRALGPHDVARKAQKTLQLASELGVDLILCGHLHISHIEPLEVVPEAHRLVVASAGTATSSRGRRSNREMNFYNVIDVNADGFTIQERRYHTDDGRFGEERSTHFATVA
jgi:3',5'-cyclic AMP phosphodiesterase CpdA